MNKLYAYLRTINPWVLTVVGLAILLIIGVAYVADQWSRQAAIERSERVVPDPGDPSTWNLPPLTDTTSRYPVDGVFDLTRENLYSGAISLATFSFSDSGKDGFGYIRFRDGKADTCNPRADNDYYNCETFSQGMLTIRDFVSVEEKISYNNTTYYSDDGVLLGTSTPSKTSTALVLAERYYGTTSDMVLLYIGPSVYDTEVNQYGVYDIFTVGDRISRVAQIQKIEPIFVAGYQRSDTVVIRTDTGVSTYVLETADLKYGPISQLLPMVSGKAIKTFPVTVYEPGSEGLEPQTKSLGILQYSFVPGISILSAQYGGSRDGGYSQAFNGVMSRVYFKNACFMPYTYSDFRTFMVVGSSTLMLDVSVNDSTVFNLTTSYYGYDPNEWGKVVEVRDAAKERALISSGTSFDGRSTELRMLAGIPVRYTPARKLARPCDTGIYEQYQWVKGTVIYSVTVTRPSDIPPPTPAEQALLKTALSGLVTGLEYETTTVR